MKFSFRSQASSAGFKRNDHSSSEPKAGLRAEKLFLISSAGALGHPFSRPGKSELSN